MSLGQHFASVVASTVGEGMFELRTTELILFLGGGVATLAVLSLAVWIFVRAMREERGGKDGRK